MPNTFIPYNASRPDTIRLAEITAILATSMSKTVDDKGDLLRPILDVDMTIRLLGDQWRLVGNPGDRFTPVFVRKSDDPKGGPSSYETRIIPEVGVLGVKFDRGLFDRYAYEMFQRESFPSEFPDAMMEKTILTYRETIFEPRKVAEIAEAARKVSLDRQIREYIDCLKFSDFMDLFTPASQWGRPDIRISNASLTEGLYGSTSHKTVEEVVKESAPAYKPTTNTALVPTGDLVFMSNPPCEESTFDALSYETRLHRRIQKLEGQVSRMRSIGERDNLNHRLESMEMAMGFVYGSLFPELGEPDPIDEFLAGNLNRSEILDKVAVDICEGLDKLIALCHGSSRAAGWYNDPATGEPLVRNVAEMLALIHSEVSEALEAHRKNKVDDHLPTRLGIEVELADALIRICDLAGYLDLDLAGAVVEKMRYNATRADHTPEARAKADGKKF